MNADEILVEIEKGVRAYKAFAEAEKIISGIRNAQQVARETEGRIAQLRADEETAKAAKAAAVADGEKALAKANEEVAAAKAEAARILADARNAAKATISDAEAAALIAQSTVDAANGQLRGIKAETQAKTAELADLNAKIGTAKAEIAKLLGA